MGSGQATGIGEEFKPPLASKTTRGICPKPMRIFFGKPVSPNGPTLIHQLIPSPEPALCFAGPQGGGCMRGPLLPSIPTPSVSLFPSLPLHSLSLSLLLEVGTLKCSQGFREHCKLPQRGLGGATAEIEFGTFYNPCNMTFGRSNFTNFPFLPA